MSKITIEDLYDRCDVLVSLSSHQSYFIQMYDPPILETDDGGLITYQFLSNDELVEVTPHNIRLRKRILAYVERKKFDAKN